MLSIETAAQIQPVPSISGLKLLEPDSSQAAHTVGVNAVWRKLLLQAEMVAPHVQVAAIEGESGVGQADARPLSP